MAENSRSIFICDRKVSRNWHAHARAYGLDPGNLTLVCLHHHIERHNGKNKTAYIHPSCELPLAWIRSHDIEIVNLPEMDTERYEKAVMAAAGA